MKKKTEKKVVKVSCEKKKSSCTDHATPCSGDDCTAVIPCCWFDIPCCLGLKAGQHCRSDTTKGAD